MKSDKHDLQTCQTLSATNWMESKSAILLSNYYKPRFVSYAERRVKTLKDKVQISGPTVIYQCYTVIQYMGGFKLSDQMKDFYQFDRKSKLCFYWRNFFFFFNFIDLSVVSSKIIYDKLELTVGMSEMDFNFNLHFNFNFTYSMFGTFPNRERAAPTHRSSE